MSNDRAETIPFPDDPRLAAMTNRDRAQVVICARQLHDVYRRYPKTGPVALQMFLESLGAAGLIPPPPPPPAA